MVTIVVCGMYLIRYSVFGIYAAYMLLIHGFSNRKSDGTRTHTHGQHMARMTLPSVVWQKFCKFSVNSQSFRFFFFFELQQLCCSTHPFHMRFAMSWRNQYDKQWVLYPFSCVHCVYRICLFVARTISAPTRYCTIKFVRGRNCMAVTAHRKFSPKQRAFQFVWCTLYIAMCKRVPHGLHRVHRVHQAK